MRKILDYLLYLLRYSKGRYPTLESARYEARILSKSRYEPRLRASFTSYPS